jgi:hypothetical protein
MSRKKYDRKGRGISGAEICRRVVAQGIFTDVRWDYREGQPGVYFDVVRDGFHAFLRRSSIPINHDDSPDGAYEATRQNPTRLTVLHITKVKHNYVGATSTKQIGEWNPGQAAYKARHNFKKDIEGDPVFARFLDDVLDIFNSAKCPLTKKVG